MLDLNPRYCVLGSECFNEVQQLDHDLTDCQIGEGFWIDTSNPHILVVYQTFAMPSPTAQRLWRGYLSNREFKIQKVN